MTERIVLNKRDRWCPPKFNSRKTGSYIPSSSGHPPPRSRRKNTIKHQTSSIKNSNTPHGSKKKSTSQYPTRNAGRVSEMLISIWYSHWLVPASLPLLFPPPLPSTPPTYVLKSIGDRGIPNFAISNYPNLGKCLFVLFSFYCMSFNIAIEGKFLKGFRAYHQHF